MMQFFSLAKINSFHHLSEGPFHLALNFAYRFNYFSPRTNKQGMPG